MHIGPWWIQPYTVRVAVGGLLGLCWLWWAAPRRGFSREQISLWLWGLSLIAVLAGRLGYIVENHVYFAQNPQAMANIFRFGGLHGGFAFVGALLALWLGSLLRRACFESLLGLFAPAMLCVAAGAWSACSNLGCAWGHEIYTVPQRARWLLIELPNIYHSVAPRYPIQAWGALLALALALLYVFGGSKGGGWLIFYFLGSASITLLRADPVLMLGTWRIDTVLNFFAAVFLACSWSVARLKCETQIMWILGLR